MPLPALQRGGRHLWPVFHRLIAECRPPIVVGEQVASADGLVWLDAVCADLEASDYAAGAVDMCAAGVGAPHIRQRLWWVGKRLADAASSGSGAGLRDSRSTEQRRDIASDSSGDGRLADAAGERRDGVEIRLLAGAPRPAGAEVAGGSGRGRLADGERPRPTDGFWRDADWLYCRDGKWRPVEPGTFPLAHGAASRVGRLRAYGNAIVPQVAATFIRAVMEAS